MRKRQCVVVWALLSLIFILPAAAHARTGCLNVHSAILIDMTDGRVLYEQSADSPIPPASVTKLLSLYIIFEMIRDGQLHLSDRVTVSKTASCTGGSRMCLRTGKEVPLEEIIKGMAVASGNDACVAVAEHAAGSVEGFVRMMNRKARELGMTNSVFNTPNGLPSPGQYSTARDLAKLSMAYIRRFPDALNIHSMQTYTYDRATHRNANRLLGKCMGVDGLKTGFVCASGFNISATAKRGDTRLIAVVLGARTPGIRAAETTALLEAGFRKLNQGSSDVTVAEELTNRARFASVSPPPERKTSGRIAAKSTTAKKAKVVRITASASEKRTAKAAASLKGYTPVTVAVKGKSGSVDGRSLKTAKAQEQGTPVKKGKFQAAPSEKSSPAVGQPKAVAKDKKAAGQMMAKTTKPSENSDAAKKGKINREASKQAVESKQKQSPTVLKAGSTQKSRPQVSYTKDKRG